MDLPREVVTSPDLAPLVRAHPLLREEGDAHGSGQRYERLAIPNHSTPHVEDTIEHYPPLYAAYATLVVLTLCATRCKRLRVWPSQPMPEIDRPWRELLVVLGVAVAIIGVGQVYQQGWLLPRAGALGWLAEAVNQALIFSPLVIALLLTKRGLRSALLIGDRVAPRLGLSVGIALAAGLVFSLVRFGWEGVPALIEVVARPDTVAHAVQVFAEDLVIAFLLVRLVALTRSAWLAGAIVAFLFVAGHIPAMIGRGDMNADELAMRALDLGLGLVVMVGLLRTRDVLWLYPTHLLLDLTQFVEVT